MTINYRLALANRSSSGLGAVIISDVLGMVGVPYPAPTLRFSEVLNSWGTLEFTLPIDHAAVTRANFALGNRELHLYRDAGAGETLVWGGKLWLASVEGWSVRFVGHSWYWDLTRREVEDDFASTPAAPMDQFDIVRALVDSTQTKAGGDLGITHFDLADSGVTRRLVICAEERRPIADVIEDLADATTGFDFAVSPAKVLRLYYPRRGVTTPTVTLNAADNISDFSYDEDATKLTTQVAGIDEQDDCSAAGVYVATDSGALATYGLLQATVNPENKKDPAWVARTADEYLRVHKTTLLRPRVALPTDLQAEASAPVDFAAVEVGDEVTVVASRGAPGGFGRFNQDFRVLSKTVEVSPPGIEKLTFGLDQVIA